MTSHDTVATERQPLWFRWLTLAAAAAIFLIVFHTLANVASRFLFNAPLPDTNEWISTWYLPIAVLAGFVLAEYKDEHIEATAVYDRLGARSRLVLAAFAQICVVALCILFIYFTALEALHAQQIGLRAGVTTVIIWPVKWLVPAAFGGIALLAGVKLVRMFRDASRSATQNTALPLDEESLP